MNLLSDVGTVRLENRTQILSAIAIAVDCIMKSIMHILQPFFERFCAERKRYFIPCLL